MQRLLSCTLREPVKAKQKGNVAAQNAPAQLRKLSLDNPKKKFVSTSCVERQNLTMRMHMRRFTRLINAFSKKLENHCHALALCFVYYNFTKVHKSISVAHAVQAGLMKNQ